MSDRRTELFAMRCRDLRDRVAARRLGFIDAIARPQSGRTWSMTSATTSCSR